VKKLLIVAIAALCAAVFVGAGSAGPSAELVNCPADGEWGIAVWTGKNNADAAMALDSCGVASAYTPEGNEWQTPDSLDNLDGVLALGGGGAGVPPDLTQLYGRDHADALPDLSNDASHSLTVKFKRPGGGSVGPFEPEEVTQVGDGDIEAKFVFGDYLPEVKPIEVFTFWWDGEKFDRRDGLPSCDEFDRSEVDKVYREGGCLLGEGFVYTVLVFVGADQTYRIDIEAEKSEMEYIGRPGELCPNPTCPTGVWRYDQEGGTTCPGYPGAIFGMCACPTEEEPDKLCYFKDVEKERRCGNRPGCE